MNPREVVRAMAALGTVFALTACHQRLQAIPDMQPTYTPRLSSARPAADVERFLADYGAPEIASATVAGSVLDEAAIRRLAVERHPQVLAAREAEKVAVAHLRTAGAWPNPSLDGRILFDREGNPVGEGALAFPIPISGRVGKSKALAEQELAIARVSLAAARQEALVEVDRLVARLAHAQARLALLQSVAARSAEQATLARQRREASLADPVDVALLLADAARDRRAVLREEAAVFQAEENLRLHLGLAPGEATFTIAPLTRVRLQAQQPELIDLARENRYTLLLARMELTRADQAATVAAAERIPDLFLGPAIDSEGDAPSLGFILGLPIPIFNTGRGPYEEALAQRRAALVDFEQERRTMAAEVGIKLRRVRGYEAELDEVVGEPAAALEQALTLAKVRYAAGQIDVLRLLSVHRAFAELKLEYLDLLVAHQEAVKDLEIAVGKPLPIEEVLL